MQGTINGSKLCSHCGRRYAESDSQCPKDGHRLKSLSRQERRDVRIGRVFAERYRLVGIVGSGGMGTVYCARQLDFERTVAIKVLKGKPDPKSQAARRFHQEAETLAQLHHPHIIRLFDFGQTKSGRLYMVMELLDGEPLNKRLWREGLTYREIFNIVMPICDALSEAHAHQIIHRDLKTENVFVLAISACNHSFPKLLDFGVAKQITRETLTRTGWLCGTPAYMSPELITGQKVTTATDMYSMGVLLYDVISGTLPFVDKTYVEVAHAHVYDAPVPLRQLPGLSEVPKRLDDLVLRLLAKDPADRCSSMPELYQQLQDIRDDCFDARTLADTPAFLRFSASDIHDTLNEAPWPEALRAHNGQSTAHSDDAAFLAQIENAAGTREDISVWSSSSSTSRVRRIPATMLEHIRRGPDELDSSQLRELVGTEEAKKIKREKREDGQPAAGEKSRDQKSSGKKAKSEQSGGDYRWLTSAKTAWLIALVLAAALLAVGARLFL